MPELIFIFFLALLIFGPAKLPKLGREVGRALGEFKRASNEFKNQLEEEVRRLEVMEEEKTAAPPPEPPAGTIASGTMAHDGPLEHPTQAPPAEPIQFSALSHAAAWEDRAPADAAPGTGESPVRAREEGESPGSTRAQGEAGGSPASTRAKSEAGEQVG